MFDRSLQSLACAGLFLAATFVGRAALRAQDVDRPAAVERGKIAISFLPPPLETATYSVGIYDAKTRKLVRHLHEFAPVDAFTVGLNGLITSWNGKDDSGKAVPPGRYAARGYAVGTVKVQGKAILGNDWAADDENLRIDRVEAIALVPEDEGLAIVGTAPNFPGQVARYGGPRSELIWHRADREIVAVEHPRVERPRPVLSVQGGVLVVAADGARTGYRLADGSEVAADAPAGNEAVGSSAGRDGTVWKIEEGALCQYAPGGERLRSLVPKEGDPVPVAVAASKTADRIYLLEESKDVRRVRGLSWKENTREGEKTVSTWTTFFENSIRPNFVPMGEDNLPLGAQADVTLVDNPLAPGKPERVKIAAVFDAKGSYLATADGLRLRQISQRPNLHAVKLGRDKAASLSFYQFDGTAWDEFSVSGMREMMGFDAGEFDLTATGERPAEKPVDPDL